MKKANKRWLSLALVFVLLVGAAFLLCLRWHAWFSNVDEEPYEAPAYIDRLTLTPGVNFTSERTLSWRYSDVLVEPTFELALEAGDIVVDSLHWVRYEPQERLARSRSGAAYYYNVRLVGLEPGRSYRYRIRQGEDELSGTFTMPSGLDTLLRVTYMGDIQDPSGALSRAQLARFVAQQSGAEAAHFFALAGDQIEGPTDKYWRVWYSSWAEGFLAQTPFVLATGNHEYLKRGFARELDPRWVAQYNYPNNGPRGFEGRSYYIDLPLARFVVLDSNGINTPTDILRHRSWLRDVLLGSSQPWQVVMFHHAVRSVREGRSNPIMRYVYQPILEGCGADLVLQGHDHAYSRIATKAEDGSLATPVYVISSSSPKVYRNEFDDVHDKLGSGLQLYQTIEVRPSEISYRSYLYSGELYDHVRIRYAGANALQHKVDDLGQGIAERFEFNAFGTDAKGQEKAERYLEGVRQRLERQRARRSLGAARS